MAVDQGLGVAFRYHNSRILNLLNDYVSHASLTSDGYLSKGYAGRTRNAAIDYVKALCRAEGIPFIDHYNDSRFQGEKQYFKDRMHLNDVGAEYYSRLVAPEIARLADVWGKGATAMSSMK